MRALKILHNLAAVCVVMCGIIRCDINIQVNGVYYGLSLILFGVYALLAGNHLFKKGGR